MNEIEQVISASGQAGVAIMLILGTVLIVWMLKSAFVEGMRLWRDAAKERNEIDEKRNEIDEKVANTLSAINDNLTQLQRAAGETRDLVAGFRRQSESLHLTAIEQHTAVMAALAPVARVETINTDIMKRIEVQNGKIDTLLKKIEVCALPETMRGDVLKLIELVTTMHGEFKAFRAENGRQPAIEPGESKEQVEPETAEKEESHG